MDCDLFNEVMDEFVQKLSEAFPKQPELARARVGLEGIKSVDTSLPCRSFADSMRPFAHLVQQGDYSFMDGERSPLHQLGLYGCWTIMHELTKAAAMEYVLKLCKHAGVMTMQMQQPSLVVAPNQLAPVLFSGFDTGMVDNIMSMARNATQHMTENDARDMIEGRNAHKLGELCFGIIDSMRNT